MSRILTACAVLALAASCAPKDDANGDGIADGVTSPDSTTVIAPSTPVGSMSGLVVNSLNQGIEGVQVTLVLGEGADQSHTYKATTSTDGAYVFKDVPAGSNAQLLFSKSGYSTAKYTAFVPSSAGNVPINDANGNAGVITLTQLSGTVRFRVYTSTGKPAKGAKAYLEVRETAFQTFNGVYGSAVGNYSGTADVDENGLLTFTAAPDPAELARISANIQFVVTIGALPDEDNDGRADAYGVIQTYTAGGLFIQPDRLITLDDPRAQANNTLRITATNLDSFGAAMSPPYRNQVKGTDPIYVVFNQPVTAVDGLTRLVKVVGEDCQTNVPVSVTQPAPNVLNVRPTASWTLGSRYNIVVRVTGLDTGITSDFTGYFFAIDATAPRPLSTTAAFQVRKGPGNMLGTALQTGDTLYAVFDSPITYQGAGPVARLYVNADLNADSMIGGMSGAGEFNGPAFSGPAIVNAEQLTATDSTQGTFTCKQSGYSTRWAITIPNIPVAGLNSGTMMRVVFPKDQSSSDTYQTAWGAPVAIDVGGSISILP